MVGKIPQVRTRTLLLLVALVAFGLSGCRLWWWHATYRTLARTQHNSAINNEAMMRSLQFHARGYRSRIAEHQTLANLHPDRAAAESAEIDTLQRYLTITERSEIFNRQALQRSRDLEARYRSLMWRPWLVAPPEPPRLIPPD